MVHKADLTKQLTERTAPQVRMDNAFQPRTSARPEYAPQATPT